MPVYWLLSAKENFRKVLNGQPQGLKEWLPRLNHVLEDVFAGQVVLVRERYLGYRPFDGLAILFVEIQPPPEGSPTVVHDRFPSPGTYIVKIAFDDRRHALRKEIDAWNASRPEHILSDNVFVSLTAYPHHADPIALIYSDANAVLGQDNVQSLESAMIQSCRFGVPLPDSIQRILRALYGRLDSHFFSHCHVEDANTYLTSNRPPLSGLLDRFDESIPPDDDPDCRNDPKIRQFRREILGILHKHADAYADPIDVLRGMKKAGAGPSVLRGTAHGDLHARNVQVAIVNDEVAHCAVYDYEKFSGVNLIAWDFIKLEFETAVRLLDLYADESSVPVFTEQCLNFWQRVAGRTESLDGRVPLAETLPQAPVSEPWKRLEDLLVSLRMIAYEHLGRTKNRVFDWLAEYDFLTAWYAARSALYPNYDQRLAIAALVAAGVAARRVIRHLPPEGEYEHRARYAQARSLARAESTLSQGAAQLELLARDYPHVLEIQEELALAYINREQFDAAEEILKAIPRRYSHTSAETPSLLGSLWKRRAFAGRSLDLRALEQSLHWYRRAAERHPDDHYPQINIATLLTLTGKQQDGREHAQRVLDLLDRRGLPDFWAIASRGEAKLLLGIDPADALKDYQQAAMDRECRPMDRRSMYDQIQLLNPYLPETTRDHLTEHALQFLSQ